MCIKYGKLFPFVKQSDSRDCGPSCLKIICLFYGKDYSLDLLRKRTFVGKDGVSLLAISRAAESIGFNTLGGLFTPCQIKRMVSLPCILFWKQEHFVVLYKIRKRFGKVVFYVSDPGKGLLKYAEGDFLENWVTNYSNSNGEGKGVALLFEPTELFYESKIPHSKDKANLTLIFNYLGRYRYCFYQLIFGLLLGSVLQLLLPFMMQSIVDVGVGNNDLSFVEIILVAQLVLIISRTGIDFIRRRILLHISSRVNITLVSDFFLKLMKLPMHFFDTKLLGDLMQRIEDHKRIERFLTAQSLNVVFSLFSLIIFSVVLFIYDVKIFFVFFSGSFLYVLWVLLFLKRRKIQDYIIFEKEAISRSKTYQLISAMQEIKLQGCEQRKRWEWEDSQVDLFEVNLKSLSLQQIQEGGCVLLNEIKNVLITILSATAVINGELTLGMMLSIQYIIGQLGVPLEQIVTFIYQMQDVGISLERMHEVHNNREDENYNKNINSLPNGIPKNIELRDIVFQYEGPDSKKVLNNINLVIPEGKVTAIVGSSGSGKTTLIKLLLGNYEPTKGYISVAGQPLANFNLLWWRSICGAVMQDGYIFTDSISDNIATSADTVDIIKLKKASKIANIDDFVSSLPLLYDTIIGQEGQGISQGQRQRLLIARAVYKDPLFIFLDEATNSLDSNNEKKIIDNLDLFYKGKTVVVVAHRLSTVKKADQIIVLDNGSIVEKGNHKELINAKGKYYLLVKNQLELGNS